MQLRYYQNESVEALFAHWQSGGGDALIDLPTGTGKSVVIAEIIKTVASYEGCKVVVATHVRELVQQNHDEFVGMYPEHAEKTGINSAGLKRREFDKAVTFCSIQSVYRDACKFGSVDIIVVDEAHLLPRKADTMYGQFLADARVCNPEVKLVGLTATPYRLDSGRLDEGDEKLFERVVYTYNVGKAIEEGFLSPVTTRATNTHFDLSSVSIRGGEFVAGELEKAVDRAEVNEAAVNEIVEHGKDRKSWIVFCSGVQHAEHIAELIRDRGHSCGVILGETPSAERARLIAEFKAGKLRALCGVSVLTTGFNAPSVDLIAMLRPTQSAGLYVQIVGRGTRLAPGKSNCLVLDFAQNIERHGPIDDIRVKRKGGKGDGMAPVKICPECEAYCPAAARTCLDCGHIFPEPQIKITVMPSKAAILKRDVAPVASEPGWQKVDGVSFRRHPGKDGKPDTFCVSYVCGVQTYSRWLGFEHNNGARDIARSWWRERTNYKKPPTTIAEALSRTHEIVRPDEILVKPNGKFWNVEKERTVRGVQPGGEGLRLLAQAG